MTKGEYQLIIGRYMRLLDRKPYSTISKMEKLLDWFFNFKE